MALIIEMINTSQLAEISNYKVHVYVNRHHIAGPLIVTGHKRSDGWEVLVKRFAKQLKKTPYSTKTVLYNRKEKEGET